MFPVIPTKIYFFIHTLTNTSLQCKYIEEYIHILPFYALYVSLHREGGAIGPFNTMFTKVL